MQYNEEIIKKLLQSESGKHLKYFIDDKVSELRDINNLHISLNPIRTAIEIRATKKAFKILTNILSDICELEVKPPPKPQIPKY